MHLTHQFDGHVVTRHLLAACSWLLEDTWAASLFGPSLPLTSWTASLVRFCSEA